MKSQSKKVRRVHLKALDNPAAEDLFLHHCRDQNGFTNSLSTPCNAKDTPLGRNLITRMASLPAVEWVTCLQYTVIEEFVCGLVVLN